MNKISLIITMCLLAFSCKENDKAIKKDLPALEENQEISEDIPTLNYDQLKPWLNKKDDKTYVVNFWATWCAPCVKELPYFENINADYSQNNVEVILVSLDFPQKKQSSLIPFVEKKNIQSKVLHFNDTNEQFWIADIFEDWSGAIPATIIYNKDKRQFYEQSFTQQELEKEVQSFIN